MDLILKNKSIFYVTERRLIYLQILQQYILGKAGQYLCFHGFQKPNEQKHIQHHQKKRGGNYLQFYYKMYFKCVLLKDRYCWQCKHTIEFCFVFVAQGSQSAEIFCLESSSMAQSMRRASASFGMVSNGLHARFWKNQKQYLQIFASHRPLNTSFQDFIIYDW